MNYGKKLKKLRESLKINQEELANILNIDQSLYSKYENEEQTIPLKHLITLCEYYQVSLDYIFNFSEIKKYQNIKPYTSYENSGKILKKFRKENKLTQVKLAKILNTTHSVIFDYEKRRYLISTPFLYTICIKYNISADYLLGKISNPLKIKTSNIKYKKNHET